jgi:hypothetical protein
MNRRSIASIVLALGLVIGGTHLALVSAVVDETSALARPGGGSSFKGGSSGSRSGSSSGGFRSGSSSSSSGSIRSGSSSSGSYSGGGGGGGIGSVIGFVFFLGIVVFIVILWAIFSKSRPARSWSTASPMPYVPPEPVVSPRRELLALQRTDPNFSLVLFDDFLVALYTEIKTAQGRGQIARYQPYLSPSAASALGPPGGEITSVIVGSATIDDVRGLDPTSSHVWVDVAFETNYSVGGRGVYTSERWTFARRRDAKSRTPDKARVIGCPNCGAPLDVIAAGVCKHCRANVVGGTFDWVVDQIVVVATEPRGPILTSNVQEEGTDEPTIIDPGAAARFSALQQADPGTTWQGLSSRVGLVFTEFQTAWAARDLARMRPFMSDALFATQTFWIEEYKRQGLRNITENARIASLELANVTQDAFYDAVTVRLYASSLDYTVSDANNQIVSGNRGAPRRYTEYWTMIRGRGAKGPPKLEKVCPNCGAPLNVTMVGDCTYCKVKVTTGQFDWVLSRIEQDEAYRG